jgi:hypothetical protein
MSSASVLNWPMDLLSASRDDVYAFTHGLMYIMDFNVLPAQLPRPRSVILAEAEAALARCLDEEDYDLAGEVLLAWPLTGNRWSAAAAFAFRVLARVEDAAGFLPAPSTRLQRLNRLEGDDRADYFLATAYHTIYVMGLLCAVSLQPDRAPPAKISTNAALRGSADRILEFLDVGSIRSHWRDELDRFSSRERDAVAGWLLNVGLHRMTKQRNFVAMRQLLATAYQLGLANTPASSQAAEVLSRLSTFEQTARVMRAGASAP